MIFFSHRKTSNVAFDLFFSSLALSLSFYYIYTILQYKIEKLLKTLSIMVFIGLRNIIQNTLLWKNFVDMPFLFYNSLLRI